MRRLNSKNHMLNIVSAKETDVDEIRQLLCKVWTGTFYGILSEKIVTEIPLTAYDYQLLKSQLQNPSIKFLIAKSSNDKIVGVINARQNEKVLYINRLYIDQAFQGQGIGIKLIDEMTNKFPAAKKIILEVVGKNTRSIKFYLKNGFSIIGKNKNQIGDNVLDVLVLKKEVKS
jgi:ribosomal protein S18 acetylase RimI-like enzyme